MPFDPEWLPRQRRFEAAVLIAAEHESKHDPRYLGRRASAGGEDFAGDLADIGDGPEAAA